VPDPPSVEALIVSFNTRDTLRDALTSLRGHRPPADVAEVRIGVLDNGSSDGSADMVEQEFPDARLLRSTVNLGFARANNQLARTSTADYLLLLNSDVLLTEDIVTPLLRTLLDDPQVIAAGPRLVYPDGQVQYSAHRWPTLAYEFALVLRERRLARMIRPLFDSQRIIDEVHEATLTDQRADHRTPDFLWATCWLIRRPDVIDHGLFDETWEMYDEDLDFCRRARQRGRTLRYVASTELVHIGSVSSGTGDARRRLMKRSRRRYYRRHQGPVAAGLYAAAVPAVELLARTVNVASQPRILYARTRSMLRGRRAS